MRWSQIWKMGIILGVTALSSACYSLNFYQDTHALRPTPDATVSYVSTALALVELGEPLSLRRLCPSGVSRMETEQRFGDGVFHYVTLGFYSPQTIKVWCKRRQYE